MGAGTLEARGIFRAQLAAAMAALEHEPAAPSTVHVARKCITRARATLRLLRDALPDATYRRDNEALRDSARALGAQRDAHVLVQALDQLLRASKDGDGAIDTRRLRRVLVRRRDELSHSSLTRRCIRASARSVKAVQQRSLRWRLGCHGWSVIGRGLKRVYARGRHSLVVACDDPSTDHLHELRNQAKYLYYQLQTLEPVAPGPLRMVADRFHRLSAYLGDDHDLAVLRERLRTAESAFAEPGSPHALLRLIDGRRKTLQRKALRLGSQLYDSKPGHFAARIRKYWRKGRARRTAWAGE